MIYTILATAGGFYLRYETNSLHAAHTLARNMSAQIKNTEWSIWYDNTKAEIYVGGETISEFTQEAKPLHDDWNLMTTKPVQDDVYLVNLEDRKGEPTYAKWANNQWHETSGTAVKAQASDARSYYCYSSSVTGWKTIKDEAKPAPTLSLRDQLKAAEQSLADAIKPAIDAWMAETGLCLDDIEFETEKLAGEPWTMTGIDANFHDYE